MVCSLYREHSLTHTPPTLNGGRAWRQAPTYRAYALSKLLAYSPVIACRKRIAHPGQILLDSATSLQNAEAGLLRNNFFSVVRFALGAWNDRESRRVCGRNQAQKSTAECTEPIHNEGRDPSTRGNAYRRTANPSAATVAVAERCFDGCHIHFL